MATATIYPTSHTLGTNGSNFVNPTNLYTDNGVYATVTQTTKSTTSQIYLESFNYSAIPSGATINSLTVNVERKMSGTTSIQSVAIQAYKSTTAVGTKGTSTAEPTTDTVYSNANTGTWSYADLANLRVLLENIRGNSTVACTISYDYVSVTVNYTATYFDSCSINQSSTVNATGEQSTPEPQSYSDSCNISQTSSLNATSTVSMFGTSSISQASTLNVLSKVSMFGSATVEQSSTLQSSVIVSMQGSCNVSQSSSIGATVYQIIFGNSSISQSSLLDAIGDIQQGAKSYTDSCEINQSSLITSSSYASVQGDCSVVQSSSILSTSFANHFVQASVQALSEILTSYYVTVFGLATIEQQSTVYAGTKTSLIKKNHFDVKFNSKKSETFQYEKEKDGDITMSGPHREEIKL